MQDKNIGRLIHIILSMGCFALSFLSFTSEQAEGFSSVFGYGSLALGVIIFLVGMLNSDKFEK